MNRFVQFLRKYQFPLHILIAWDFLVSQFSRLISTCQLKVSLRLQGCRYGPGLSADGPVIVRVQRRGAVSLGERVTFRSRMKANLAGLAGPVILQCLGNGQIIIGDRCGFSGTVLSSRSRIYIGSYSLFGVNTRVYDHDFHSCDPNARRNPERDVREVRAAPVVIGSDVFVGANALILKGCNIGDRTIIGANAVVANVTIPPDSLVVGNPAKILPRRG